MENVALVNIREQAAKMVLEDIEKLHAAYEKSLQSESGRLDGDGENYERHLLRLAEAMEKILG